MRDHLKTFGLVTFQLILGSIGAALFVLLIIFIDSFVNDLPLSAFLTIFGLMLVTALVMLYKENLRVVRNKKEENK